MQASESRRSTLRELLIGTLVLSVCFVSLCAYASYQKDGLNRVARSGDRKRLAVSALNGLQDAPADSLRAKTRP